MYNILICDDQPDIVNALKIYLTPEGSGLGLNIAAGLMQVQGGALQLTVDGDLFKAALIFPCS